MSSITSIEHLSKRWAESSGVARYTIILMSLVFLTPTFYTLIVQLSFYHSFSLCLLFREDARFGDPTRDCAALVVEQAHYFPLNFLASLVYDQLMRMSSI
jgi:hypothetical protein